MNNGEIIDEIYFSKIDPYELLSISVHDIFESKHTYTIISDSGILVLSDILLSCKLLNRLTQTQQHNTVIKGQVHSKIGIKAWYTQDNAMALLGIDPKLPFDACKHN